MLSGPRKYLQAIFRKTVAAALSGFALIPISTEVQCRDRTLLKITAGMARLATQAGAKDTPNPAATNRSTVGHCGASCTPAGTLVEIAEAIKEHFDVELSCGITALCATPARKTLRGISEPGDCRGAPD